MDSQQNRPIEPSPSPLSPAPQIPTAAGPNVVEFFIPYRNGPALVAYYLAVFSVLCGALLGIPAVILGIFGLKRARAHPEARGAVHAWVGILLGALTTIVTLAVVALLLGALKRN